MPTRAILLCLNKCQKLCENSEKYSFLRTAIIVNNNAVIEFDV